MFDHSPAHASGLCRLGGFVESPQPSVVQANGLPGEASCSESYPLADLTSPSKSMCTLLDLHPSRLMLYYLNGLCFFGPRVLAFAGYLLVVLSCCPPISSIPPFASSTLARAAFCHDRYPSGGTDLSVFLPLSAIASGGRRPLRSLLRVLHPVVLADDPA